MRTMIAGLLLATACTALVHAANGNPGSADAELNATYKALLSHLDDGHRQRLREAQRAWITFRDKECAYHAASATTTQADCAAELTLQRTDALKRQIKCPAGNSDCTTLGPAIKTTASADVSCRSTAGRQKAEEYVRQCIEVSPSTHPPCNDANACELIIDEIRRACALIEKDAPAYCAQYAKPAE